MNLFIPITKIDEAKRIVYGTLTQAVPDRSGEIIDYPSTKAAYQKWSDGQHAASKGKSKGNLRAMHGHVAAGKFTDIVFDDDAQKIEGAAYVSDDAEWKKCLDGTYTGFSHGGSYAKRWTDPDNPALKRYTPELAEVSLVDAPCVPTATFEFIKQDGSRELRKFITHREDPMTDTTTDTAAPAAETDRLTKAADAADPRDNHPADKGGVVQGFMAKDGTFHLKKADALQRNSGVDALQAAAPALAVLEKLDAAAGDEPLAKKDYSDDERGKMADAGEAMADGSYPIKTKKDLENAVQSFGRAKDKDKVKAHIEARAKALDAEDLLPESWDEDDTKAKKDAAGDDDSADKSAPGGDLQKGMSGVQRLADLVQTLSFLQACAEREEAGEQDDSTVPAQLKAALATLGGILKQMTAEEVDELLAGEDEDDLPVVLCMAAKSDGLAKRGAKLSAASKEHIEAMHKSASDHMAAMDTCYKALGMGGDDGDEPAEKLAKRADDALAAENAALKKALGDMTPKLEGVLAKFEQQADLIKTQNDRIAHLEKQPAPAKGVLRAVGKADDGGHVSDGDIVTKFNQHLDALPAAEKSNTLMKLALANPVRIIP